MIFGVIDTLIADGATEEQKMLALKLGIIGAVLPHGERNATIQKLIVLAPRPGRANLLLSLVLSGEDVEIKLVADGIAETFEAAKRDTWILTQADAYHLRAWLRLLPFATPVSELPAVVRAMPDAWRNPNRLGDVVEGLGCSPLPGAEAVLFKLAEDDPRFYLDRQWRSTVLRLSTASSGRRLVDLTVGGALSGQFREDWHWRRELGGLIAEFPEVRTHIQDLLKDGLTSNHLAFLAHAIAERPGLDGLLMLIDLELKTGCSFLTNLSIESVVTEQVPTENWQGAYDIVAVPATELRRRLLAMTTGGGANGPAARYLNYIDQLRDRHGADEREPRHPDLTSGLSWPIIVAYPKA